MCKCMIVKLYIRRGHNNLFLGSPINKVASKKNSTISDGVSYGNTSRSINIQIGNKMKAKVIMKG